MTVTEKKSKPSTKNIKEKFTEAHEVLLTGLIGSGLSMWECFQAIMALSEAKARMVVCWMVQEVEKEGDYPSRDLVLKKISEVKRIRGRPPKPKNKLSTSTTASES